MLFMIGAGCEVLMPWGAPIGSGQGLNNPSGLRSLRGYFPGVPLVVVYSRNPNLPPKVLPERLTERAVLDALMWAAQ